jgi:hypothetical protein
MRWIFIAVVFYSIYYTAKYAQKVWKKNKSAGISIALLAASIAALLVFDYLKGII